MMEGTIRKVSSSMAAILAIFLCGLALSESVTVFQDCGSEGTVLSLEVTGCTEPPCVVVRPNHYSINITFIAAKDAMDLQAGITAIISDQEIPWPAPNACGMMGDESCPLVEGNTYPFSMTMQVKPEYPEIHVLVRTYLTDEDGVMHACVELPYIVT